MIRSISTLFLSVVLFCLPLLAAAAPGLTLTSIAVKPQDAPKVIAAIDEYMNSSVGKQFKGRLLLQQHVADGADPSTHSIVQLFHSAAEAEAFAKLSQASPEAWGKLMDALGPISQPVFTGRMTTLQSWGDINDTDNVWFVNYFSVSDTPAYVAALDAWRASPKGKSHPGQAHLFGVVAGGMSPTTHIISAGYASIAEAEAYADSRATDPDWLKLGAALQKASVRNGSSIVQTIKTWGPATTKSLVPAQ